MKFSSLMTLFLVLLVACQEEAPLRQKIGDNAAGDRWIYDDWAAAQAEARKSGKPIMVVFRCVP